MKYVFSLDNCLYKDTCPLKDSEECNSTCLRYIEMFYMLEQSGLSKGQRRIKKLIPEKVDISAFKTLGNFKKHILNFVQMGKNLYIYSNITGNAKTSWAIKLMLSYFNSVWAGNRFKCRALFIHVPTFMLKLRENITEKSEDFQRTLKLIPTVDLVIWDDIAACDLKEFDHLNLLSYIDSRCVNLKSNIYTGNLNFEEMKKALGGRLASRVYKNSMIVNFKGTDRRGDRYKED